MIKASWLPQFFSLLFFKKSICFLSLLVYFRFGFWCFWVKNRSEVWCIPINLVKNLYLKQKRPGLGKNLIFGTGNSQGGIFDLPKDSTWYLSTRGRVVVTTSGQTVSFYNIDRWKIVSRDPPWTIMSQKTAWAAIN